ncbi:MAG TPA: glycosyltransferase family 2 protein [Gammaproteobacteria bacterium]|nr:glycosyltransferase family 2 protein [Gammaproteobacteria bacterium]
MAKISACIISFNEEKKIEDCLKSLQGIADEIVVVDSNSTDNTVAIAAKYTDRIINQDFLGFIEQKNFALEQASHDWILSLDCDERLSEELRQSILAIKDTIEQADAYSMARKTFYVYRWLNHCWYPDLKTRLFNRKTAHWGGTNPHDHIITEGSNIVRLAGDIQHYSFDSISDHLKTIDRFTEIGAQELIRKNRSFTVFSPLTHSSWLFFKIYILKRGFLDGFAGLVVATLSFMHVFIKYSKAIIMRKQLTTQEN